MWSIKKILYYNDKSGQSYLLLKKNKSDYKTEQSDLLRHWYTNIYDDQDNLCSKKRFEKWLNGKDNLAIEDMVSKLRTPNQPAARSYPDTIIVNGWLPSICPNVHYTLELDKEKSTTNTRVTKMLGYTDTESTPGSYNIKKIVWINIMPADKTNMAPIIEYMASRISKGRREERSVKNLRGVLKKSWKEYDWTRFTPDNYEKLWDVLGRTGHLIAPIDMKLGNSIFASSFDTIMYSCLFGSKGSWGELCDKPEHLLLQGEHYNRNANIDDLKRLLLLLGRDIPENIGELEDANRFIKALKRQTCLPIQFEGRTASTTYIQRSGEVWATAYDIKNTAAIVNWFEGIPLHVGYVDGLVENIPYDTPVFVKHVDDKLQWWSFMSYGSVTTEFPPDGDYIIGEAHHFSQEDWLFLSQQRKPLAIFGRKDILGARQRGHIFFDMAKRGPVSTKPCLCENTEILTYEEACGMKTIPTQVYVSTIEDKRNCSNFPILKKMKRVWMNGPRRLCTETGRDQFFVYTSESDGSENKRKKHRILDQKLYDGNVVCTFESYQRVQVSVLIITEHTKPIDIYRVRSYTSEKVFLVEKGAGVPSIQYTPSNPLTLINI